MRHEYLYDYFPETALTALGRLVAYGESWPVHLKFPRRTDAARVIPKQPTKSLETNISALSVRRV
jgi:hypothetical protein